MSIIFQRLNSGWNAEPNAPDPQTEWHGNSLRLRFLLNAFQFPEFDEDDRGEIVFADCSRFRIGKLNDEGWYRGQGRFGRDGHRWGEFYEVFEGLELATSPDDWIIRSPDSSELLHFLFYFRDQDFECLARRWTLNVIKAGQVDPVSFAHNA